MKGSTYRRCYCRDPKTGKPLGKKCPKLSSRKHGTYSIRQELPPRQDATRRSFNRAGYDTLKDAQKDLDHVRGLLALAAPDEPEELDRVGAFLEQIADDKAPLPDIETTRHRLRLGLDLIGRLTVADWLDEWLAAKKTRRTTNNGYASHIRVHLKPRIGHIRLDRLNVGHLVEMFDAISDTNEVIATENEARDEQVARCKPTKPGRPPLPERNRLARERAKLAEMPPYRKQTGPASRQAIRRTLRAALNAAIARQLITFNPASHVELESGKRPKPLLWTPERVERWRATGEKPSPVMVWTPVQFGTFLDAAEGDRLYALFHLCGTRGLRRGEGVGQDWDNVDLEGGAITPARAITVDGWDPYEDAPKTDGSAATIALDTVNIGVLREHRARQQVEREAAGPAWQESGKVFTNEDGSRIHPETASETFRRILARTDLPPITFRDLRHVAATVVHAGGGDLHTIKETLRHSTIVLASDTYTSLLPEVDRSAAEAGVQLIPRARGQNGGRGSS
ncbi:integrase [Streptomyces nanshensis]|nr:integrase [Streptomyces nanshensis]